MKKISALKIILCLAAILVVLFSFVACNESGSTEEVTVKEIVVVSAPDAPYLKDDPNVYLGDVVLKAVYSNKKEVKFNLEDGMLSGEDRRKFYEKAGRYTVAVNYDGGVGYYAFEVVDVTKEGNFLASFYSRGGTEIKSKACKEVVAFTVPEREGYTFDGWFADPEFTADGKVAEWGTRAVEPYTLTSNTAFYAKWIDNRVCTVKFVDSDGTVLYEEKIHYGEKIDVKAFDYPEERVVPGKTFISWNVTNGDPDEVTADMTIRATFRVEKCMLKLVYANTDGKETTIERTFDYGTRFEVGDYVVPVKEGYDSRFVVYVNHAEDEDAESGKKVFTELSEDKVVVLTEEYTTICPEYTILTYDIVIWNGKENQTYANLKSGEIELERVYENKASLKNFTAEWNGSFDFSEHKQDPDIGSPAAIRDENGTVGYKSEWCFVVNDSNNNEIRYNEEGFIWNEAKQIFEAPAQREEGESAGEWTLRDADKNYIALIKGGVATGIKNNVIVKALYTKKTYNVRLVRQENGSQKTLVTFKAKYLSDINVYDTACYPHKPNETKIFPELDVTGYTINDATFLTKTLSGFDPSDASVNKEKLYLKENTSLEIKKLALDGGYYETSGESTAADEEDWIVEWYDGALFDSAAIDFNGGATVEVNGDTSLYCKDVDQRKYELLFYYDYNFDHGNYDQAAVNPIVGKQYYTENEKITPPTPENVTCTINGVTLTYTFVGWYDVSYKTYLQTGNRGKLLADRTNQTAFSSRTNSVYYYAHYESTGIISVEIYDKTQSIAFIGKPGYENYGVADKTIAYTLSKGSLFDLSMVYKGQSTGTSVNVSGQYYYDGYKKNTFFGNVFTDGKYKQTASDGTETLITVIDVNGTATGLKNYLESLFGNTDTKQTIKSVRIIVDAMLAAYDDAVVSLYLHNYEYSAGKAYQKAEYEYYLTKFANALESDVTTLGNEYESVCSLGESMQNAVAKVFAGEAKKTLDKLGSVDEFIGFYAKMLKKLYDNGFTDKHTGLNGIGYGTQDTFDVNGVSTYNKLLTVSHILSEYEDLLTDKESYSIMSVTPRYDTSVKDLNEAYDYTVADPKYVFSGWYSDAAYTQLVQTEFSPLTFVLSEDCKLYAKWTDITKGTEGLVYEEVTVEENGATVNGYVLVDFVNRTQYEELGYGGEHYYVTANDAGAIPELISGDIELAIPAAIDKYLDKTADALSESDWSKAFSKYMVIRNGSYVPASAERDENEKYYVKKEYPVVGVKKGALDSYASQICKITIPLNLYYVEDGAFRNCNATSFEQIAAKDGETARETVFVHENKGIYGNTGLLRVTGKTSEYSFVSSGTELTLKAYAAENAADVYALTAWTKRIGDYAFAGARNLVAVNNVISVVSFGDYAFKGASKLKGFDGDGVKLPANAEKIGMECFAQCSSVESVTAANGSKLRFVGKDAFIKTKWLETKKGVVSLRFIDENGLSTGIIIGYYSNSFVQSAYDGNESGTFKYDENGTVSASGTYSGITSDDILVLISGGKVYKVIVRYDVKFVSPNAFEKLDACVYDFKSVKAIGDEAFSSCASLERITINDAFNGESLDLGKNVFSGRGEKFDMVFSSDTVMNTVTSGENWDEYDVIIKKTA